MNRSNLFLKQIFPALVLSASFVSTLPAARAQEANPTTKDAGVTRQGDIFFYKVQVVQRDLDAVNYLHRSGSTKIAFKGTSLLPMAKGEATVKSERGGITIDASFQGLTPANGFGKEYLTYVLWAISADGSPRNLGEVLPAGTKNNITVTTSLQAFGLIVTAEPYFAVTTPSDVIVLQNQIIQDKTNGVIEKVNAHYTLLPRGNYADTEGAKTNENPITRDERSPLELYEAYNAVRIATKAGAQQYSPDILARAKENLKNAADIDSNKKGDRKMEITFARGAVQGAEDARVDTLRKQAAERQQNAIDARKNAEMQSAKDQLAAQQAQLDSEKANAAKAQADAARAQAEAEAADARAKAAQANKSAEDANAIREKLRAQLNNVLATSESARGLIVNMSDVLFDTGKYTLKPGTQISLAKVAGILQAYPGLKLQVEGYTDSVGGDEYNQKLSENRAGAVKDFLVTQGVSVNNITAAGYGKTHPVADNGTAAGRAQNRRVNLVVSGDAIGVQQSAPTDAPAQ
ncbi:Outer membrane protein OmpA [Granulicella rosea]|uniref:Outer membrane protein OmpA n=1 Tax=Granulicella rosea TaxID=474952 RepID=A0A239CSW9_9BACT|nr:OmpA family protein [Granulicella rosea]SNS22858.1 Outer membrane protein OmpA [Granulicella rosea]